MTECILFPSKILNFFKIYSFSFASTNTNSKQVHFIINMQTSSFQQGRRLKPTIASATQRSWRRKDRTRNLIRPCAYDASQEKWLLHFGFDRWIAITSLLINVNLKFAGNLSIKKLSNW